VFQPAANERAAIAELRRFISFSDDADVEPGSPIARKLDAARRAIAAYEAAESTQDEARSAA
jgi:hypothetical protein